MRRTCWRCGAQVLTQAGELAPGIRARFAALLADDAAAVRDAALAAFCGRRDLEAFERQAIALLRGDPDVKVRWRALRALQCLEDRSP